MELTGLSFIGSNRGTPKGTQFHGMNPQTGAQLEPAYHSASVVELDQAARLAADAFATYSQTTGKIRAAFLRRVANGLEGAKQELAERANLETALPLPRLT